MHFLKENKRIGEIPLSISLSLFSVIPRLFKIDRFSWNVRPWRRFVAFFDQCSWNVRPWRRFVAFFSINVHGTWGPGGNFTNAFVFLQRMHLVKGDLYYHQNSRMHFLKENKRIGEIPLSISLSLFSVIPRLFKIDRFSWNVRPWRRFVAFFDQCSWNVRPWRRFVAFFSINVHGTWREFHQCVCFPSENASCQGWSVLSSKFSNAFSEENKRIGEIPLSISLSLFSVIPRLFKIDRFSWNVKTNALAKFHYRSLYHSFL